MQYLVDGKFAAKIEDLAIPLSSGNLDYVFEEKSDTAMVMKAIAKSDEFVSFSGGIEISDDSSERVSTIICQGTSSEVDSPTWSGNEWSCGQNDTQVE